MKVKENANIMYKLINELNENVEYMFVGFLANMAHNHFRGSSYFEIVVSVEDFDKLKNIMKNNGFRYNIRGNDYVKESHEFFTKDLLIRLQLNTELALEKDKETHMEMERRIDGINELQEVTRQIRKEDNMKNLRHEMLKASGEIYQRIEEKEPRKSNFELIEEGLKNRIKIELVAFEKTFILYFAPLEYHKRYLEQNNRLYGSEDINILRNITKSNKDRLGKLFELYFLMMYMNKNINHNHEEGSISCRLCKFRG